MEVWTGWGYGIAIFRALNFFQISEPEKFGKNRSFCEISGVFLENSASGKFSFGLWKMAIPYATNPYPD